MKVVTSCHMIAMYTLTCIDRSSIEDTCDLYCIYSNMHVYIMFMLDTWILEVIHLQTSWSGFILLSLETLRSEFKSKHYFHLINLYFLYTTCIKPFSLCKEILAAGIQNCFAHFLSVYITMHISRLWVDSVFSVRNFKCYCKLFVS